MSWSDDEFDVDQAVEKQMKKKDFSDEDSDEEPAPQPKAQVKAKPKAKTTKKAEPVEYDKPLSDPKAEAARRKKLQERADARNMADLFAGCDRPSDESEEEDPFSAGGPKAVSKAKVEIVVRDAFDQVNLKTQADVDELCTTCVDKVGKGKAKGAQLKFLTDLLKELAPSMESKDIDAFEKDLAGIVKAKRVNKTEATAEKRKTNEKLNKNTKFNIHDETTTMYGGGAEDWDDWDEDWDDWEAPKK